MSRKSLNLVLVGLMILSAFLSGCRKSAAPPVEELAPEDGGVAMQQGVEPTVEDLQPTVVDPTPESTEGEVPEPTQTVLEPIETEEPEPTLVTEEVATPVPTSAPPQPEETPVISLSGGTYVVQPGDNLFRIALNHGVTLQALSQANNITNPALIYIGQELTIPQSDTSTSPPTIPEGQTCSTVYVVQPGDNLFRIALRHNQSQMYLAQINGIANPALIHVGQQICIP